MRNPSPSPPPFLSLFFPSCLRVGEWPPVTKRKLLGEPLYCPAAGLAEVPHTLSESLLSSNRCDQKGG